ncbi:helix-turn-helix transcriptional regulator [bacterium]|nr:helix-turn-helix transcriptional regulator [bacterium]
MMEMKVQTARDLGILIRKHRIARVLTQTQLAKALGASQKWVSDVELGKERAQVGAVLRALGYLGVELRAHERSHASSKSELDDILAQHNDA